MSDSEKKAETPTETAKNDHLDRKTLFVRAVPTEATSDQLSEYFSQFVPVKHAVIVTDGEKKSRGFGFVSFTMEEDTLTALVEAKKNKFMGRHLRVDVAKRRDRKNKEDVDQEPVEPKKTESGAATEKRKALLIVRNLPWSCKPETLRKIFSKFGAVHDAYIPAKKGGLMKGFGFVIMKKKVAADRAAKECVGLKIDGREVAVDLAVEKSDWVKNQEKVKSEPEVKEESDKEEEEEDDDEKDPEIKEEDDDKVKDFEQLNEMGDQEPESEEEEDDEEEEKPQNKQEAYSVFVRNIPYDADQDSLKTHFEQFGPVKYALPVVDRNTGVARGSAFVAFKTSEGYDACLDNAPTVSATSMLISDDVAPEYVYQGRILSIAATVDRNSASKLAERNSEKRKEAFGKDSGDRDRRNLYLLNEGRITSNSKLAQHISPTDLELREKSYRLRVQQLNKNPTLHLSLTRLAVRNLPRAMTDKALKALGRKAVVEFATEVKNELRQPLSKEEVNRSIKYKHELGGEKAVDEEKKKNKKLGVVRQAKVIMEVKGTGAVGRSRGYGFIEFRDHKSALMGLRWLNAHEVTKQEIMEGMTDEEKKMAELEGLNKRKLIVEFAVENAQVVKRRREKVMIARHKRQREDDDEEEKPAKKKKGPSRKGNMNKGPKKSDKPEKKEPEKKDAESVVSESVKHIIARKRKDRRRK